MNLKRLASFVTALLLSLSSLLVFNVSHVFASTFTCTWTGGGSDAKFSTTANWSGCNGAAPLNTDTNDFVFDNSALTADAMPNNDIVGLTVNTITFQGTSTKSISITGNALSVAAGITATGTTGHYSINTDITLTSSQNFTGNFTVGAYNSSHTLALGSNNLTLTNTLVDCSAIVIDEAITGSGTITKSGAGDAKLGMASTYTGATTISAGALSIGDKDALGSSSAGTTVSSGASLGLPLVDGSTIAEPITIGGTAAISDSAVAACYGGAGTPAIGTINLTGVFTLTANSTASLYAHNFVLSSAPVGSFTLSVINGSNGSIISPSGSIDPQPYTNSYTTDSPSQSVAVGNKETATIDAHLGGVTVSRGGLLLGTGTVGDIFVDTGGTIAPGHSPGCMNTGNVTLLGTYNAEIGGTTACTGYDQLKVTGTVDLTGSTLNTTLYNNYKPKAGEVYTIIDNDSTDPITSTFANLAEGATFSIGGNVFKISYIGGSGNDVTLTVKSVPATPDTGFTIVRGHPLVTMVVTVLFATGIAVIARRYKQYTTK